MIEGHGRFLIPGLQDLHVHLATRPEPELAETLILPLLIAHGVTGVRDMGGDWARIQALRRSVFGGARPGPSILSPGPFLDGPQPPDPGVISATDAAEARTAVRSLKDRGVDFVKVQAALSREAFFAAADEARSLAIPFAGRDCPPSRAPEVVSLPCRSTREAAQPHPSAREAALE